MSTLRSSGLDLTPKPLGKGRPYPTDTPLGKLMAYFGLRQYEVCAACQIAPRTMTEILAGRKEISRKQMARLCEFFGCTPNDLTERE